MSDKVVLETIDLAVSYGEREVLGGVSLKLRDAELLSIVGPNGSGKSTLVRAITGYIPISRGQIRVGEDNLSDISPRERAHRIAVVPQSVPIPFSFTVREIVEMGRYHFLGLLDPIRKEDREAVEWALETTDTIDFQHRRADHLSGGELQRVVLARALAQKASIILMDEPTTFLDLGHEVKFFELMADLCHNCKISILCVSHDLNFASEYSDRIIILRNGRILHEGTPDAVINEPNLREVYGADVVVEPNPFSKRPQVIIKRPHTQPAIFPQP